MLIYIACSILTILLIIVLLAPMSRSKKSESTFVKKNTDRGVIEKFEHLLRWGQSSDRATSCDVDLLKKHGLYKTLPIIKINNPSMDEYKAIMALKESYIFTTYFIDCSIEEVSADIFQICSDEVSAEILFALNRLRLVNSDKIDYTICSKGSYRKRVKDGLIYEVHTRLLPQSVCAIVELMPKNFDGYCVVKEYNKGYVIENIKNRKKIIINTSKNIKIIFDNYNKQIIYLLRTPYKQRVLNIKINFDNNYVEEKIKNLSIITTDLSTNNLIRRSLSICKEIFYKKYMFMCEEVVVDEKKDFGALLSLSTSGLSMEKFQLLLLKFFGVDVSGDYITFDSSSYKGECLISLSINNKKVFLKRKESSIASKKVCVGGVDYINYTKIPISMLQDGENEIFFEV